MMRWTKRNRNKLIVWLGAAVTFLIVVALALNFAADLFLRAMVPTSIDEAMKQLEASEATTTESPATSNPSPSTEETPTATENVAKEPSNSEGTESQETATADKADEAGSSENTQATVENSSDATLNYSPEITPEKAKLVEEEITIKEKAKVMATLMGKLSPSEIALFTRMAGNGLTVEEKKEAKKVFLKKLSEDEYNELISIASKYGLSQGKSHEDSLKDMEAE